MPTSARVAAARDVARVRQTRERRALRLLGLPLLAVVVVPSLTAQPAVAAHGRGLIGATALVCLVGAFAFVLVQAPRLDRLERRSSVSTVLSLVAMAAAGVTLSARQASGTGQLALALVAWLAGSRLSLRAGAALVVAATAASVVALAADASLPATAVSSSLLLAVLLFLMARIYRGAQADRERAEVAAAELADARERELRSAGITERRRAGRGGGGAAIGGDHRTEPDRARAARRPGAQPLGPEPPARGGAADRRAGGREHAARGVAGALPPAGRPGAGGRHPRRPDAPRRRSARSARPRRAAGGIP